MLAAVVVVSSAVAAVVVVSSAAAAVVVVVSSLSLLHAAATRARTANSNTTRHRDDCDCIPLPPSSSSRYLDTSYQVSRRPTGSAARRTDRGLAHPDNLVQSSRKSACRLANTGSAGSPVDDHSPVDAASYPSDCRKSPGCRSRCSPSHRRTGRRPECRSRGVRPVGTVAQRPDAGLGIDKPDRVVCGECAGCDPGWEQGRHAHGRDSKCCPDPALAFHRRRLLPANTSRPTLRSTRGE